MAALVFVYILLIGPADYFLVRSWLKRHGVDLDHLPANRGGGERGGVSSRHSAGGTRLR